MVDEFPVVLILGNPKCWLRSVYLFHSEDSSFCKGLLSLLFSLHILYKSPASLLLELCQDIHSQLGDIDEVNTNTTNNLRSCLETIIMQLVGTVDTSKS